MLRAAARVAGSAGMGAARLTAATAKFVGKATMQAAERLIPHGAAEVGSALFTGNAYAPPVLHSPEQGNVHGTAPVQQQAAQAPAPVPPPQQQATGWGQQVPMGHREIGQSLNAKIIDMQPQIAPPDHARRIEAAAARIPQARDNTRSR